MALYQGDGELRYASDGFTVNHPETGEPIDRGTCQQAPARQASLGAGLPLAAGCTTINKMCGSGMKAMMLTHDLIAAGSANIVVAAIPTPNIPHHI